MMSWSQTKITCGALVLSLLAGIIVGWATCGDRATSEGENPELRARPTPQGQSFTRRFPANQLEYGGLFPVPRSLGLQQGLAGAGHDSLQPSMQNPRERRREWRRANGLDPGGKGGIPTNALRVWSAPLTEDSSAMDPHRIVGDIYDIHEKAARQ